MEEKEKKVLTLLILPQLSVFIYCLLLNACVFEALSRL
jgi:hypothetical protein